MSAGASSKSVITGTGSDGDTLADSIGLAATGAGATGSADAELLIERHGGKVPTASAEGTVDVPPEAGCCVLL